MADGSAPRTRATGICPRHAVTAHCGETQAQRQGQTCVQRRTSAGSIAARAHVHRHRHSYSTRSHLAAKSELVQHVQISTPDVSDAIRPSSRRRRWSVPLIDPVPLLPQCFSTPPGVPVTRRIRFRRIRRRVSVRLTVKGSDGVVRKRHHLWSSATTAKRKRSPGRCLLAGKDLSLETNRRVPAGRLRSAESGTPFWDAMPFGSKSAMYRVESAQSDNAVAITTTRSVRKRVI